ncbi:tripsin, putative [Pediculus humanus corporis]|uniref:Tripsin, putative n=1 Tax=Pediculus humanus subsp. corporis TaxID=121224 RepID=E0VBD3_PEDHC|nr:tripsin, putative [Pediculus humanus corporis]EEB10689.1 tripsin, putative [Pediculus humanus corporis]
MTAGHCMCSGSGKLLENRIRVTIGEHDLKIKNSKEIDKKVIKIHFHPKYQCGKFIDDIALLELENDIYWTKSIGPACLPKNYDNDNDLTNRSATLAGWGWLNEKYSEGRRPDILQKVQVNVFDNDKCRDWYSSQGKNVKILNTQLCAGHESGGKDACWADSGGPLMISESDNSVTVVGVVSTGIGCGRPKLPGIYTRITEYIPWILNVINN